MKTLFTKITLCLIFIGQTVYAQKVGDTAPDFTLNTIDNSTFQLSQHTGTVVMILFFGYSCPHCLAGGPSVQSDIVSMFSGNPDFLAIGVDAWDGTKTQVESFRTNTGLKIDMCLMGSSIETLYGLTGWDRIVIVGKDGNIAFKGDQYASQTIDPAKAAIEAALNVSSKMDSSSTTAINNVSISNKSLIVYPNPAKDITTIGFELLQPSKVSIQIRNVNGKLLYTVQNGYYSEGKNSISFNAGNLPGGVYYIVLKATDTTEVSKFVVY